MRLNPRLFPAQTDNTRFPPRTHFRLPRWLDAILLLALCVYIYAGVPLAPFHGDESTHSFMTRDYHYLFIARDPSLVLWHAQPVTQVEQYLRVMNGVVNKYLVGAGWHAAGYTVDDLNNDWDWGGSYEYNLSRNARLTPDLLTLQRTVPTFFTCLSLLLVYGLAYTIAERGAAWGAVLLFAFNPALLLNGRRMMLEGTMIASMLLTVLAGVWAVRAVRAERLTPESRHHWRSWLAFAGLGIAIGLAIASKHNNAVTVGIIVVGVLLLCLPAAAVRSWAFWKGTGFALVRVALAVLLGLILFYALNPAWWGDPIRRFLQVAQWRRELLDAQAGIIGGYATRLDQFSGFIGYTFRWHNQYAETPGWLAPDAIGGEIVRYESSGLAGLLIPSPLTAGLFILLSIIGVVAIVLYARIRASRPDSGERERPVFECGRVLFLFWSFSILGATWILTPLPWQRYYLPAIITACLLAGAGMDAAARLTARLIVRLVNMARMSRVPEMQPAPTLHPEQPRAS